MTITRQQKANAIRALSMDAVQQAASGHPGMPMGMADIAEVLWSSYLRHDPADPAWTDRDRFVVSNGHGSMLLYSLLHLTGYDLTMEDIRQFRQLHSRTPGHPEYGETPGVETTTGPLGQGLANAVGMAIAERALAAEFNRPDCNLVDHYTYVFAGDGCLMEGISHEACSLAGTLGLGKLIVLYDDNGISIDGDVQGWFSDDTPARFGAYGWHVMPAVDGHDSAAISHAIDAARRETSRPSLICCKTMIGFGSPNKAGKESSHGAPLGEEEVALSRQWLGWDHAPFEIPDAIYEAWDARPQGAAMRTEWSRQFEDYEARYPELSAEFKRRMAGELPPDWQQRISDNMASFEADAPSVATRKASEMVLNKLAPGLPELVGGSADLTGSNLTRWQGSEPISNQDFSGRYIFFGVREFAMAAITNGISLHGGFVPFCSTFLMFSEYARNALRMAALMRTRSIFVFTHDSIGLGEDGPTHQPVEQAATLRLIPGMSVWRPCDVVESAVGWQFAVERGDGPTSLLFTRQGVPFIKRTPQQVEAIMRGGYVLKDCGGAPDAIIIATGSEVALALQAAERLEKKQYAVRVVSMPSTDVFDRQTAEYRESVLPRNVRTRVAVEAGSTDGWRKYVGLDGDVIGIDTFGASAPSGDLYAHFGITVDRVIETVERLATREADVLPAVAAN